MKEVDDNDFKCPECGATWVYVIKEWSNIHSLEELIHCPDCDGIFVIHYKFDKIVKLKAEEIELKWPMEKVDVE